MKTVKVIEYNDRIFKNSTDFSNYLRKTVYSLPIGEYVFKIKIQ